LNCGSFDWILIVGRFFEFLFGSILPLSPAIANMP